VRTLYGVLIWFVAVYFGIYVAVTFLMTIVAGLVTRRRRHELLPSTARHIMRAELAPAISICVPAYNESAGVVDTVRSLLSLDYPQVEVVVANDGSTDTTLEVLRTEFGLEPSDRAPLGELPHEPVRGVYAPSSPIPLVVIDKENGGAADALNAALIYARGPLVLVMDADEVVANDTLALAVRPFLADPFRTVAVGATLGVANGCRIVRGRLIETGRPRWVLPLFQAVEYDRTFRVARLAWSTGHAMAFVSGGFGLLRRDLVIAVGGYDVDTIGEDFDLTLRLHRFLKEHDVPYRIAHVPDALCWTLVPESRRVLGRQRRRWHRGLWQVLSKERGMVFRPRYGVIGFAAVPWAFLELLSPLILVFATLTIVLGTGLGIIGWQLLLLIAFVTWACTVVPTLAAFLMTESPGGTRTGWRNLGAVLAASGIEIGYQWLTLAFRLDALLFSRRRVAWGDMERSLPSGPSSR
jgi:cellulose synthase/poly-beta-1,6-N-acetylglucosamine synthase-like glycosyltransferase